MQRSFHCSRTHFLLKLLGGMMLYWATAWMLKVSIYGDRLLPSEYIWLSLLLPAAALMEHATRPRELRRLCGLPRDRVAGVSQREILFLLVLMLGFLVMTKDDSHSRIFLGSFAITYAFWIGWMNRTGHRKLHRYLARGRSNQEEPAGAERGEIHRAGS